MVINMLDDLRRANRIASQRGRGPGRVGLCLGAACVLLVLEPVPPDAECDAPEPAARSCPATRTGARRRGWLGSGVVARGRAVEHHRQRLAAAVLRVCVEERGPILDARHALRAVHGRPPGRRNTLTLFRVRSGGSQRMASCRVGSRCSARARTFAHGDCRLAIVCYPNSLGLLRQLRFASSAKAVSAVTVTVTARPSGTESVEEEVFTPGRAERTRRGQRVQSRRRSGPTCFGSCGHIGNDKSLQHARRAT